MTLRQELLEDLAKARRDLLASVERLSETQMTAPLPDGDWSPNDILAHVTSWEELRAGEVLRVARGGIPVYGRLEDRDFDHWNELLMAYRRELPLDQVRRDLGDARQRLLATIASLGDEEVARAAEGRMRIRRAADHEREHAAQINEWRQREGI